MGRARVQFTLANRSPNCRGVVLRNTMPGVPCEVEWFGFQIRYPANFTGHYTATKLIEIQNPSSHAPFHPAIRNAGKIVWLPASWVKNRKILMYTRFVIASVAWQSRRVATAVG